MERRDKTYYDDISVDELWEPWCCMAIVAMIIAATIYAIILLCIGSNHRMTVNTITTNTAFNELPQNDRQVIAEWNGLEVDENFFIEVPAERSAVGDVWLTILLVTLAIALTICSALLFAGYCNEKLNKYFLADLPFGSLYGWTLFFAMYIGWIILAVSAVRMKIYFQRKVEEEQKVIDQGGPAEEVTYEDLGADHCEFDEDSLKHYVEYSQFIYQNKIERFEEDIEDYEKDLRNQGDQVRRTQAKLAKVKAELNELTKIGPPTADDHEIIETLEAIKVMRGVVSISYSKDDDPKLVINVHVRIPYDGETYDGGDYMVQISGTNFSAFCIRPGTKSTWPHGKYPDYRYEHQRIFCLGKRTISIQQYLAEYRLREAAILIIDCLHSTGDQRTTAQIPNCFRRIVPPTEKEGKA